MVYWYSKLNFWGTVAVGNIALSRMGSVCQLTHGPRSLISVSFISILGIFSLTFRYVYFQRKKKLKKLDSWGFPGGAVVENLPANAGDTGSSPGLGRSHMPWGN